MGKYDKLIIEENGMLTNEAMIAYVDGQLSATQNAAVEKIIANDPFAAEALEGLKTKPDSVAGIHTTVYHINQKIKEKTGAKPKKNPALKFQWINYAFAASVVGILLGVGIWFVTYLSSPQSTIAKNEAPVAAESEMTAQSEAAVPVENTTADTALSATAETAVSVAPASQSPAIADAQKAKDQTAGNAVTEQSKEFKKTETIAAMQAEEKISGIAVASPQAAAAKKMEDVSVAETPAASSKAATSAVGAVSVQNSLQQATAAYNRGDYKSAQNYYADAIKENPTNVDAIFYGGVSSYINGDMQNAERNFDALIKKKAYKDGANWYKANILLKKGENAKAKDILRELTNTNGYYKERAIKLYEQVK